MVETTIRATIDMTTTTLVEERWPDENYMAPRKIVVRSKKFVVENKRAMTPDEVSLLAASIAKELAVGYDLYGVASTMSLNVLAHALNDTLRVLGIESKETVSNSEELWQKICKEIDFRRRIYLQRFEMDRERIYAISPAQLSVIINKICFDFSEMGIQGFHQKESPMISILTFHFLRTFGSSLDLYIGSIKAKDYATEMLENTKNPLC